MNTMSNYHVVKRGNQYGVLKEGAERVSDFGATQKQAEKMAKEFCANSGGGEVRIHAVRGPAKGQIRDSDTVYPGNDPRSSIDTKH